MPSGGPWPSNYPTELRGNTWLIHPTKMTCLGVPGAGSSSTAFLYVRRDGEIAAVRSGDGSAPVVTFTLDAADMRTKATGLNGGAASEVYVQQMMVIAAGADTITYNKEGHRTSD